jgi:4-carboxymuconolactone decarboxylase
MVHTSVNLDAVRSEIGSYADTQTPLTDREQNYKDLVGLVPPRIAARLAVTGALDPELLGLQEEIRRHAMYPACFDTKTAQVMLFGMLLIKMFDGALVHGRAARRAGATWEEMQAVVSLAYLFGGIAVANRGAEILAQLATSENNDQTGAKV